MRAILFYVYDILLVIADEGDRVVYKYCGWM
jgi:hypothetical protein